MEYTVRLKDYFNNEVVPALMKSQGYTNVHQVPKIDKIILNMRLGDVKDNQKSFNAALDYSIHSHTRNWLILIIK